ncbi:hypothetical protein KUCAC02_032771, partial [Chaenocephalus aceratus]
MVKWCSAGTCGNHHSMTDSDGKSKFSFFKFPSHEKQPGRRAQQPSKEPGHPDYIPTKFATPGKLPTAAKCQKLRRFWNAMSRHGKKMLGKANGPSTKKCRVAYAVPVGVQDTSLASSEPPQHQPTPDSPQPSTSSVSPPSVPQQMLFDETSALGVERDAALAERDHARATLNSVRLSSNTVAGNNEKCIVLGVVLKTFVPMSNLTIHYMGFPGEVFMRVLQMVTIPLMVTSVLTGVCSMSAGPSRKISIRAAAYFISTTLVAPGVGQNDPMRELDEDDDGALSHTRGLDGSYQEHGAHKSGSGHLSS